MPTFDLRAAWMRCVSATDFSEFVTREELPKGDNPTINRFFLVSGGGMYAAVTEYVADAQFFLHAKADLLAAIERIRELERRLTVDAINDELRRLCCDRCSNDEPRDEHGRHPSGPCDAWTETEAADAAGKGGT